MIRLTPTRLIGVTVLVCLGYIALVLIVIAKHNSTANEWPSKRPKSKVSFASAAAPGSFSNETYCYVHVGKASGSKLSCELGFRYAPTCPGNTPLHTDSTFATKTDGYIHMFANSCKSNSTVFLISVRNPIERMVSWYNYENARQKWVHQPGQLGQPRYQCLKRLQKWGDWDGCFETLDELATNCTPPTSSNIVEEKQQSCQRLAWDVVRGTIGCAVHNEFNYANYRNAIHKLKSVDSTNSSTTRILVIRSEHMADDWNGLEVLFGGINAPTNGDAIFRTVLNKSKGNKEPLSWKGLQNLCRALCDEIQIYKSFILAAENLNSAQKAESLNDLRASCQDETYDIRTCPSFETE